MWPATAKQGPTDRDRAVGIPSYLHLFHFFHSFSHFFLFLISPPSVSISFLLLCLSLFLHISLAFPSSLVYFTLSLSLLCCFFPFPTVCLIYFSFHVYLLIFPSLSLVLCYSSILSFCPVLSKPIPGLFQARHLVSKTTGHATSHFLQRRVLPEPNKKLKNFDLLTLKHCYTSIVCETLSSIAIGIHWWTSN